MSFLAAPNRVPLADIPSVAFYFYHFSPSFSLFRAYILPFSRKSLRDLSKTARRFSTGDIISFATKGEDYILTRFDNKRFFLRKKGKGREKKLPAETLSSRFLAFLRGKIVSGGVWKSLKICANRFSFAAFFHHYFSSSSVEKFSRQSNFYGNQST